jgi:hypothetical protein
MKVFTQLETKDLWQSAFMLAQGSSLEDIRVKDNGRREVFFVLSGDNIARLAREFRSGRALCNVASLRASMLHLKEEMFKVLRA